MDESDESKVVADESAKNIIYQGDCVKKLREFVSAGTVFDCF